MSQNPFSPQAQFEYEEPVRRRMSVLAVTSFIFSLVCCIPGTGAIAALLGTAALFRISRSEGRLRGTGLAVAGIIIGLIVTAVMVGIFLAFGAAIRMINADANAFVRAVESKDVPTVQSFLSGSSGATVTDAEVAAFASAIDSKIGKFISPADSLLEYGKWWMGPAGRSMGMLGQSGMQQGPQQMMPHPVKFDKEIVVLLFEQDPMAMGGGGSNAVRGTLRNVGVLFNDGSTVYLLNKPAPAPPMAPSAPGTPPAIPAPPSPTSPPTRSAPSAPASPSAP